MMRRTLLTLVAFAIAATQATAQLSFQQVSTGFIQPLFVTAAPGGTTSGGDTRVDRFTVAGGTSN